MLDDINRLIIHILSSSFFIVSFLVDGVCALDICIYHPKTLFQSGTYYIGTKM